MLPLFVVQLLTGYRGPVVASLIIHCSAVQELWCSTLTEWSAQDVVKMEGAPRNN